MPRQIYTAANLRYKGQPTISFSVDGVTGLSNQQLPNHTKLLQRRVALPAGMIGYKPQIVTSFQGSLDYQFEGVPEVQFNNHQLFHYVEVTFSGTVEFEIFVDEVRKSPNNNNDTSVTLTTRDSRTQDTRRIYFPPLSFGWIPHVRHVINPSQSGQIFGSRTKSLPPRFFKGEREHTEAQITHQGNSTLNVYLDGRDIGSYQLTSDRKDKNAYKTVQEYLPSGARGNVLQWIQTSGDGEIALFETDTTLTDNTQPQQEV